MPIRLHHLLGSVSSLAVLIAAPAFAQQAPPTSDPAVAEVVVTGSLIRGIAPVGTNVVSVGQAQFLQTGATSVNSLLTNTPALTNMFNIVPNVPGTASGRSSWRPNIRNLPESSGQPTLVLMDGHNMVGVSVQQVSPDMNVLPPGALERIEVDADGGSAMYGSNAVGGVINLIPRKHFQGIEMQGNVGVANGYKTGSLSVTGGNSWNNGGFVVSLYSRAQTELGAQDRKLPRANLKPYGGTDFRVQGCDPGNIVIGTTTYALPGRVPGTLNLCDQSANGVITPAETQYSAYASISQSITPYLEFNVTGYASDRVTKTRVNQRNVTNAVIDNTNPFFVPIGAETRQTVEFSYASAFGPYLYDTLELGVAQFTPQLTWKADNGWQANALMDFGWSKTTLHVPSLNLTAQNAALRGAGLTTATALDPYNLPLTNPAVLAKIDAFEAFNRTVQSLQTYRLSADGPLFSLPGGKARLAVGAQYQITGFNPYNVTGITGDPTGSRSANVHGPVESVFAELNVPVFGPENRRPLVQAFDFDFSGRYDNYDLFGSTFNPKVGATWTLSEGYRIRGNWGTSFVAPTLREVNGGVDGVVQVVATNDLKPGDAASNLSHPTINITGAQLGVKSQTANTWSVGFDMDPPQISGLKSSVTYWFDHMDNLIVSGPPGTLGALLASPILSSYVIYKPTLAQAQAITAPYTVIQGATSIASLYGVGNDPYIIKDVRRTNLGSYEASGVDFSVSYRRPTSWGAVFGRVGGTRFLKRRLQAVTGGPYQDQLSTDVTQFQGQVVGGFDFRRFTAQATMNYTAGYKLTTVPGQTSVGAFNPVNLFFSYDAGHELLLTLNIDNVLNISPPLTNVAGGIHTIAGFVQQSTLGQVFNFGIRKRF